MNTYFYFHAGSNNHGCEAIVRSTVDLLGLSPIIISDSPESDRYYGIEQVAVVRSKSNYQNSIFEKVRLRCGNDRVGYYIKGKHESKDFETGSTAFSIGGDNYCYGNAYNWHLEGLNRSLHKRGVKTILWGCSIEPSSITESMKRDFALYDCIVAREKISYNSLKDINANTLYACDPAFMLKPAQCALPDNFSVGNTVGINISPLIQKKEKIEGITERNYHALINYILEETDFQIALIPHVVCKGNDDREPLQKLYNDISKKDRVCLIEDHDCMELKWIISQCAYFVGARTHATIAAYSSCVPTLVVGYSTKAVGIARDLFGQKENYVLPVQGLMQNEQIIQNFEWLTENGVIIREHLKTVLPNYCSSMKKVINQIKSI